MVPPPGLNTVAVCNQITLLIINCNNSKLVTLLKVIDVFIQLSDILGLTLSFKLAFSYFFLFFLVKCLLASRLTFFRLSMLLWFGSCTQCILACFI